MSDSILGREITSIAIGKCGLLDSLQPVVAKVVRRFES